MARSLYSAPAVFRGHLARSPVILSAFAIACGSASDPSRPNPPNGPGPDGGVSATLKECFDTVAPPPGRFVEIQAFTNADEDILLWLARAPGDGHAVGETFPYELKRFGLLRAGELRCLADEASFEYEYGHHNWDERITVVDGASTYFVTMQFFTNGEAQWTDRLTISDTSTGQPVLGPLPLTEDGCRSIPYDYNPCFQRMRTDRPGESAASSGR